MRACGSAGASVAVIGVNPVTNNFPYFSEALSFATGLLILSRGFWGHLRRMGKTDKRQRWRRRRLIRDQFVTEIIGKRDGRQELGDALRRVASGVDITGRGAFGISAIPDAGKRAADGAMIVRNIRHI